MHKFISWIEKNGKNYFLTSADLASKRGQQLREHCKCDDDLVGHGAIRWFYGEFTGGIDRKCTDFTDPRHFPIEIIFAIKNGNFRGMGTPVGLLSQSARADYKKIWQSALADCDKIWQSARADYDKIWQSALADYEKIGQSALADCDKIWQSALDDYEKIRQSALDDYEKIRQSAFCDLFAVESNRAIEWRE